MPPAKLRALRGARIGMIFQDPLSSLHPYYKVGWQIVELLRAHDRSVDRHAARRRAIELLDLVGIPEPARRVDDYPHQFSGGMRQRVMIAMSMALNPSLLIADEPTTALDVTVQAQILAVLEDLQRSFAMAIILITHDLGVIAEVADEVVVMYAGSVMEQRDRAVSCSTTAAIPTRSDCCNRFRATTSFRPLANSWKTSPPPQRRRPTRLLRRKPRRAAPERRRVAPRSSARSRAATSTRSRANHRACSGWHRGAPSHRAAPTAWSDVRASAHHCSPLPRHRRSRSPAVRPDSNWTVDRTLTRPARTARANQAAPLTPPARTSRPVGSKRMTRPCRPRAKTLRYRQWIRSSQTRGRGERTRGLAGTAAKSRRRR